MSKNYKLKIKDLIVEKGNTFLPNNFVASKLNVPEILIGRDREKKIISENIKDVLVKEGSKIIRIIGTAGVGKSSIILYLREASRNEEFEEFGINIRDFDYKPYIYLIYIQMESHIPTGGLILKFFRLIYDEFGGDGFFINLAHKLIGKIVIEICDIDLKSKEKIEEEFSQKERRKFNDPDDFEEILEDENKFQTIHKIVTRNYKKINNNYLINLDQGFINLMCNIISHDSEVQDEYLRCLGETAERGKYGVVDDITAIQILSNIILAIKYVNKYCCITIAIDHLETYTRGSKSEYMDEIFKMIMEFRNRISNNLLLILISTTQGYNDLINGLRSSSGDINQLFLGWNGGEYSIDPIATDEFIKVIKHYWDKTLYKEKISVSPEDQFYPFCQEGLEFLYEKITAKSLRASFNLLKSALEEFKSKKEVEDLTNQAKMASKFDANTHPIDRVAYMFDEICSKFFNLNNIAKKLEQSLEKSINKLKNINEYPILTVVSNKKVGEISRKPDVFIQFGKNNEECAVEIQVKAYHKSELSIAELESSIELLNQGITDYCLVLVTRDIKPIIFQQLKPFEDKMGFLLLEIEELQAYLAILVEDIRNDFFEDWKLDKEQILNIFQKIKLNLKELYIKGKDLRKKRLGIDLSSISKSVKISKSQEIVESQKLEKISILEEVISKYNKELYQLGDKRIEELKKYGIIKMKDLAELNNDKINNLLKKNIGARISKTLLLNWQKIAEELVQKSMEFKIGEIKKSEIIFSTKEQHFLREYDEIGLNEKEIKYFENRGILTIEEILEPKLEFLNLRKPNEINDQRFLEIREKAQELTNSMKFELKAL